MPKDKEIVKEIFAFAGVTLNGSNPWDITIHNEKFYSRLLADGELGLGESYVAGWWDCPSVDQLAYKTLLVDLEKVAEQNPHFWRSALRQKLYNWARVVHNFQTKKRAFEVGKRHYDTGNDLFKAMLDKRMVYTCGYWKDAKNLDQAQEQKLELVCKKMALKPGMKLLDIGCGWGSFVKYAAENYGISAVGITVSKEQAELGRELCKDLPIDIRFQDYRDLAKTNERFDRVISLGMFEHVGYKNYRTYMQVVKHVLSDDGLFLLHTIGRNTAREAVSTWIHNYIFPTGQIPTPARVTNSYEEYFIMEDWENFGVYYDPTLMAWHHNFNANWDSLRDKYDEHFRRMWNYYLLICAGSFRARHNQLWQLVLSNKGIAGGYTDIRSTLNQLNSENHNTLIHRSQSI